MSTVRIKVAALALISMLGVSAAHAQDNYPSLFSGHARAATKSALVQPAASKVEIKQKGRDNGAAVGQNGRYNVGRILQDGILNTGRINQDGTGNSATVRQLGKNNDASITQQGNNNVACVVQVGKNLSTDVVQQGDGQRRGVVQTKKGTHEFPAELCALDAASRGYWNRIGVKGY